MSDLPVQSDRDRLRRLARCFLTDQLAGAVLELTDWCHEAACPPAARILLATGLLRQGRPEDALESLRRGGETAMSHPEIVRLRASLLRMLGQADQAAAVASLTDHPMSTQRLRANDWARLTHLDPSAMSAADAAAALHEERVASVAGDLSRMPRLIPSLVAAQKVRPTADSIVLLRQAIGRVHDRAGDRGSVIERCAAMAELAELAGDHAAACHWAGEGLLHNPYHATCALVASRCEDAAIRERHADDAGATLTRVARRYPKYADVRAALVRHHVSDGRIGDARVELWRWLGEAPEQPIALQMEKDLAA